MPDHTPDELLLAHLKTVPALAALHGYTGQDNAGHKLPALTISTTSEPRVGSDTAFRGAVSVVVESAVHDASAAALANRAAINATGRLHICGYAPLGTEPTAGDDRFNTKLRYRFGPA